MPDNETMIAKIRSRIGQLSSSKSLSARALQSSVWVVVGFVGQRGLQFVSNLILTRLLFPEAFGIMALASVFLTGLAMFSDIGLKPAIIRDARSREPDFLNTAWTIQIVRGFGLFSAGCLLAYPVSEAYGEPILLPLLVIMSSTAAISGFQTVGLATAERDLEFFRPTLVALIAQLVSITALITLAWYWRSVWALAAGNVIGALATVVIGHCVLTGHRHQLKYDRQSAQSIVSFGRWIMLSTIATFVGGEGLRAIQAGLLTLTDFGVMTIAYTFSMIATELPSKLTGTIGLPALVEANRSGPGRMAHVLQEMRKRLLVIAIPMASVFALASNPLISLLYDKRYHEAGRYAALLVLSNTITIVFAGYFAALLALGRSKSYLGALLFVATVRIAGTIIGFWTRGIVGLLIGLSLANVATLLVLWAAPSVRPFVTHWLDLIAVIFAAMVVAVACSIY